MYTDTDAARRAARAHLEKVSPAWEDDIVTWDADTQRLRNLLEGGVILGLHVERPRLTMQINDGFDVLGVLSGGRADKELNEALQHIRAGVVYLRPPKKLNQAEAIERAARKAVQKWAVKLPLGWFITPEAWEKLKPELEALKAKYMNWGRDMVATWDADTQDVLKNFLRLSRDAYLRLRRDYPEFAKDENEFIDSLMTALRAKLKQYTAAQFLEKVNMYWELRTIVPPEMILEYQAAQYRSEQEKAAADRLAEAAQHEASIIEEVAQIRLQKERMLAQIESDARRQMMAEVLQSERAQFRKATQEAFQELKAELYSAALEIITTTVSTIRKNGRVFPATTRSLGIWIDVTERLNTALRSSEIEEAIAEAKLLMQDVKRKDGNDSSIAMAADKLQEMAALFRHDLIEMGYEKRVDRMRDKKIDVDSIALPAPVVEEIRVKRGLAETEFNTDSVPLDGEGLAPRRVMRQHTEIIFE